MGLPPSFFLTAVFFSEVMLDLFFQKMELRDTEFALEYFVTGMCIDHRFGLS